jgi:LCP family protein required for cell wall assembly
MPSPRHLGARTVTGALLATVALCAPNAVQGATDLAIDRLVIRNEVERSDLDPPTSPGAAVWLVVGSDARGGLTPTSPDTSPANPTGQRADSVSLWVLDTNQRVVTVVSLPRDLRVEVAGHGELPLGVSYAYGPRTTLHTVQGITAGLPIHHVAELDFTGVTNAVDVLGGVELYAPYPARDIASGLRLNGGLQRLTGSDALAWSRSRNYEEFVNGAWIPTGGGDLARIERQHALLRALVEAAHQATPRLTGRAMLEALHGHFRVDKSVRTEDVLMVSQFFLSDFTSKFLTIPVERDKPLEEIMSPFPPNHLGGNSYMILRPEAKQVLSGLAAVVRSRR